MGASLSAFPVTPEANPTRLAPHLAARVGIVGLGYVGLPLALAYAQAGVAVVAVDIDERKLGELRAGRSYIDDVSDADLQAVGAGISPTSDYAELADVEAVVICVPTPLNPNREPDLEPLLATGRALGGVLRAGQLVVLESTTFPGTTRELLRPALESSGLRAGEDFNLAFSPERVDPGRSDFNLRNTPKVVGGLTDACAERAEQLMRIICDEVIRVSSPDAAELTKLLENVFRSVNIALVNELAMLAERMGIDIWEVIDAASTKPYGFMRFEPGPGMGGHCLPVDPFYLSWRAREFDAATEFVELAGKINQRMPYHCVELVQRALNDLGRAVRGARITLLGVSYKGGVSDTRESPALKIATLLAELGAELTFYDPYVESLPQIGPRAETLEDALNDADIAVIVTTHPGIDHAAIAAKVPALVDLRGATRPDSADNVVLL